VILGLMPHPDAAEQQQQQANRRYLEGWMDRLVESQLSSFQ